MDNGYLAEVRIFAGNFAPRNWAFCAGQLLSIAQNQALFSLLGTTYGGDGRTSFGLPDMRGRAPIGPGQGPGLTNRVLGQRSGQETHTMSLHELPVHNHIASFSGAGGIAPVSGSATVTPQAVSDQGGETTASGMHLCNTDGAEIYSGDGSPLVDMASYTAPVTGVADLSTITGSVTVQNNGGSYPFNIMQPWLSVYYIICLQGLYPSRS